MSGGGGGPIIIRPMLQEGGGRLTEQERKALQALLDGCSGPLNEHDAGVLSRIVKAYVKRP